MERHDVGDRERSVEIVQKRDAEIPDMRRSDIGVVAEDIHSEGAGAQRNLGSDASESDDKQLLPVKLISHKVLSAPLAAVHRCVRVGKTADRSEHHGHRVLRGGERVSCRRVDDYDAATARLGDVDVVHTDSRSRDHAQTRGVVENFAVERRAAAREHSVRFRDGVKKFRSVHSGANRCRDVLCLRKQLHSAFVNVLRNKYVVHDSISLRRTKKRTGSASARFFFVLF